MRRRTGTCRGWARLGRIGTAATIVVATSITTLALPPTVASAAANLTNVQLLLSGGSQVPHISDDGQRATANVGTTGTTLARVFGPGHAPTGDVVALNAAGIVADGQSDVAAMSRDGRFVALRSRATNLSPTEATALSRPYLVDLDADGDGQFGETGDRTIERLPGRVSVQSVNDMDITPDGRYVTYTESGTDVDGACRELLRYDRQTHASLLISANTSGNPAGVGCSGVNLYGVYRNAISANGNVVAFDGQFNSYVAGDTDNGNDIFVRDVVAGVTTMIPCTTGQECWLLELSDTGDRILYVTGTSAAPVLRVYDRTAGVSTVLGSVRNSAEYAFRGFSPYAAMSADGQTVVWGRTTSSSMQVWRDGVSANIVGWTTPVNHFSLNASGTQVVYKSGTDYYTATIANTAPDNVSVSLVADMTETEPSSLIIPIDDQLLQAVRGLGLDVAVAPGPAKRAPGPAKRAPGPAKRAPGPAKRAPLLDSVTAVDKLPLNQVPIAGGWKAVLVGAPQFNGRPLHLITFGEVLRAARADVISFSLADIDVSRSLLDNISPVGYLLGATPAQSLVIDGQPWCDRLATETGTTCAALGISVTESIAELDVQADTKVVLDAHPVLRRPSVVQSWSAIAAAQAPITTVTLANAGLKLSDVGDLQLADATGLGSLTLAQLGVVDGVPTPLVECGIVVCTPTTTLASVAGAIRPSAHLRDIEVQITSKTLADIAAALPTDVDVADVAVGLLEASDYPWEDLDVQRGGIQQFAAPADQRVVTYTVGITLTNGEGAFDAAATVNLPLGFTYKAGTAVRSDGGYVGDPLITSLTNGSTLRFAVDAAQAAATTQLSFQVYPGYRLGSQQISADVRVVDNTPRIPTPVSTTVIAPPDVSDVPGETPISNDVLRVGYSTTDDSDLYTVTAGPRDIVTAWVSHADRNADLVLYGPPADLPGTPNGLAVQQVTGTLQPDPTPASANELPGLGITRPGVPDDAPAVPGIEPVGASALPAASVQAASATGAESVQVSSYNGATSDLPYVVRVKVDAAYQAGACTAPGGVGVAAPAPDLTALPTDLETLILVDVERLGDSFGSATDAADVLVRLGDLAASPDVKGAVIPLDALIDDSALDAPGQWCDPAVRNDVARSINSLIATIRGGGTVATQPVAAHLGLRHIVIVGNDDVIPMARLLDPSRLGNEDEYADSVPAGPVHEALATGHYLSDDPYVDLAPTTWFNRQLYVPDMAIGRLVETKAEILGAVDAYLDPDGNPATTEVGSVNPQRVYASGYDFMADGARDAATTARDSFVEVAATTPPATNTSRVSSTWTGANIVGTAGVGGDMRANDNDFIALYGHFDHDRALSAAGYTGGTADGFTPTELADALPGGTRLVLTMGCHSGLSVPGSSGDTSDFAQAVVGTGAAYIGVTAYGYGTEGADALHERLMTEYAGLLGNQYTIGESFALAKQHYQGSSGLHGPYDEKALMSATFYGLPFLRISGPVVPVAPVPLKTPVTVPGQGYQSLDLSLGFTHTTEPATNGDRPGDTGDRVVVTAVTGVPGTDVSGLGQPLVVSGQPQQPQVAVDVTAGSPSALTPAHGVLITDVTALPDLVGFDGAFVRPTLVDGIAEGEVAPGSVVFPQTFAAVTTFTDPAGVPGQLGIDQRQQLVLSPGQYRSDGIPDPAGVGVQTLFSGMNVSVLYSTSTDYTPPSVRETTAELVGNTASLTVRTDDPNTSRAVALVRLEPSGQWIAVELVGAGTNLSASFTLPVGASSFSFIAQIVDEAGNVAVATGRGAGVAPVVTPTISVSDLTAAEGDDTHLVFVPATITPAPTDGFTFDYEVTAVSDLDGSDLELGLGATIYVAPGQTSIDIPVNIYGDSEVEPDGVAAVSISISVGTALVGDGTATVTITDDDAVVPPSVYAAGATFTETEGTVEVVFTATQPVTAPVTVDWSLALDAVGAHPADDQTDADIIGISGTATFGVGDTVSSPVTVTLHDAGDDEFDETFLLHIDGVSGPANASVVDTTITLTDDEVPKVVLWAQPETSEGMGPIDVVVEVDIIPVQPVIITLGTVDGTAVAGGDFQALDGLEVTLPAGPGATQHVPITLLDDLVFEPQESFELTVQSVVNGGTGIGSTLPLDILDDDDIPEASIDAMTVSEPGTNTVVQVTATLTNPASVGLDLVVDDTGAGGTASVGSDYAALPPTTVHFAPGATTATFPITVKADALDEPDETIALRMTGITPLGTANEFAVTYLTITDDDPAPVVSLGDATLDEADEMATITLHLDQPSGVEVQVSLGAVDGTAEYNTDYLLMSDLVTFAPGQTEATVVVDLRDSVDEPDQTFSIVLTNPVNTTFVDDTATFTIIDDDAPPVVVFGQSSFTLVEGDALLANGLQTQVLLEGATEWPVSFTVTAVPGTAAAGTDYAFADIPVEFAPGESMQIITVDLVGDAIPEFTESFSLQLVDQVHVTAGDPLSITITDDDQSTVSIASETIVAESIGTASVTLTLDVASPWTVVATVNSADIEATAGADYTAVSGATVTFAPGQTSRTVSVAIINDTLDEVDEAFTLTIAGVTAGQVGAASGSVIITDDDVAASPVSIADASVTEGNAGTVTMTFPVSLSAAQGTAVTLRVDTVAGTATAGADYTSVSNLLVTIPAGQTTANVTVTVASDVLDEADETLRLVGSSLTGPAIAGDLDATGTIVDNDPTPSLTISNARVSEGASGTVTLGVKVTLSAPSGRSVTVHWATTNGTATASDYVAAAGDITFTAGQTERIISVTVKGDKSVESDEWFAIDLTAPVNATLFDPHAVITILNDDRDSCAHRRRCHRAGHPRRILL